MLRYANCVIDSTYRSVSTLPLGVCRAMCEMGALSVGRRLLTRAEEFKSLDDVIKLAKEERLESFPEAYPL